MKALVYDTALHIDEIPMPTPAPGEALIRVLAAGICNTDIEIRRGYMAYTGVLGHEFVGIVEKTPTDYLLGKRVVGEINCICGCCRYCLMEMPNHCLNRTVLGIAGRPGAFAEYITLPEKNLHIVPTALRDDVAVFAEPLAAAFRITEQIAIGADDHIIILGDGKLGQLIAQTIWLYSKNILCIGKHLWKCDMLTSRGIAATLHTEEITGDADIVIDATGSPESLQQALTLVRPEGTVVLKTTCAGRTYLASQDAVVKEVRLIGSRCGPFRPALEALALGTVETRPMISETYPLDDGPYAMNRAEDPGVMKVVLHISD